MDKNKTALSQYLARKEQQLQQIADTDLDKLPVVMDQQQTAREERKIQRLKPAELAEYVFDRRMELFRALREKYAIALDERNPKDATGKRASREEGVDPIVSYQEFLSDPKIAKLALQYRLAIRRLPKTTRDSGLTRHKEERDEMNGNYKNYKTLEIEKTRLNLEREEVLRRIFKQRGKGFDQDDLWELDTVEQDIAEKETAMQKVCAEHSDVAAQLAYEQALKFLSELRNNFVWTESRVKALKELERAAISSKPLALILGESGTGKTTIVRAAATALTGKGVRKIQCGKDTRVRDMLYSKSVDDRGAFTTYNEMGQAFTGKLDSRDKQHDGGSFLLADEINMLPPDKQQETIKTAAQDTVDIQGQTLRREPNFFFIGTGNPPGEKYENASAIPVAAKREFGDNVISLDYVEQTEDRPEIYQILVAAMLDKNGRLTAVSKEEIAPKFDFDETQKKEVFDPSPEAGGMLWRFSNAIRAWFDAFSYKSAIEPDKWKLDEIIIDLGTLISWVQEFQLEKTISMEDYFKNRLRRLLGNEENAEEAGIVKEIFKYFGIDLNVEDAKPRPAFSVMTPREIGYLFPNVPRKVRNGKKRDKGKI